MSLFAVLSTFVLAGADRGVDPTFLRRSLQTAQVKPSDISTTSCRYKPLFGVGDDNAPIARGVVRFGEITVDAGGLCATVNYRAEEQVYVVLSGEGTLRHGDQQLSIRKLDFTYIAPGVPHGLSASKTGALQAIVMGFKIPPGTDIVRGPARLANIGDVQKQVVGNHPPSTLYQLLVGDVKSTRDRIAAGNVLTSLFIMEFAAGGTNFPHHHDREEEIYLVLDGYGDMVAGGGMNGVEGRHPARAGDAFFFRLNCTVGFYAGNKEGEPKARILAVRSLYPFGKR